MYSGEAAGTGGEVEGDTSVMATVYSQHPQQQSHSSSTSNTRRSYLLGIGTNAVAVADRREGDPRADMVADGADAGAVDGVSF